MLSAEWLNSVEVEKAIQELLVQGEGYLKVIEALRAVGRQQGEYTDWLDAELVKQAIHGQAVRGKGVRAVVQATAEVFPRLMSPRTPEEQAVFVRLRRELTNCCRVLAGVDVKRRDADVEKATKEASRASSLNRWQTRDLIVREQLVNKASAANNN